MHNDVAAGNSGRKGIWNGLTDRIFRGDEIEEEYEEEHLPAETRKHHQAPARAQQAMRTVNVGVRQPQSFEDAKISADGLKDGRQQIVNLEKTSQDVSERIIDFLMGVTYALNGFVEQVGDRVYLFAPSNVTIDGHDDMRKTALGIFDRGF